MKKIKNIVLIFSAIMPIVIWAQPNKQGVPDQQQDVIKNFDAKLLDAEKVVVNPILPPVDTSTKAQTYGMPNKVLGVEYQPPRMRPVQLPQAKLPPQYNGYAKLGYGFPNSPYAEAAYRFGDPTTYLVGAKVKHHSANNDKVLENQRFSKTEVEGNGTFYAQAGLAVDAKLGYTTDSRQFYGYDHVKYPAGVITEQDSKQFFNTFAASAKAYNSVRTVADFNYALGLDFSNMNDNYANGETDFGIKLEGTKWFAEKHPLTLVIKADFTTLSPKGDKTQDLNNIYLQPSFTFKGDVYSIKLGGNFISNKDVFYPKPDIEATVNLAGSQFAIFGGWKGDFTKNSYRNLTTYNPFLSPDSVVIKNTDRTEYYGGIKGSIALFDYSAQVGWSNNKNLALFLADTTEKYRRFKVIYDSVDIFNIRGAITLHATKELEIVGTVSQNIYTAKQQIAAWGLPSLDVNVSAKYAAFSKGDQTAVVKAALFVQNGVPYKISKTEFGRLDGLFDINIGGEYWFSKNIGAFLDVNNLLNLKRQRWQNYPSFGLNLLGGITARF